MGGEKRREVKSLRIGVHLADAVVWEPVYRTHLSRAVTRAKRFPIQARSVDGGDASPRRVVRGVRDVRSPGQLARGGVGAVAIARDVVHVPRRRGLALRDSPEASEEIVPAKRALYAVLFREADDVD
eukprot:30807-Pelagococcus_subviridis.AAC.8